MANLILWNSFGVKYTALRPLGAHQIASWLTQNGYTVEVIDFCHLMSTDDLVRLTAQHITTDTIAVGVSSTFWTDDAVEGRTEPDWILSARQQLESTYTLDWLLGGSKSTFHSLKLNWIKIHGHGEDSVLDYMDKRLGTGVPRSQFNIQNLCGQYVDNLHIEPSEVLSIELGRGCQFKCSFCRYPLIGKKKGTYIRDLNLVRDEFLSNYERYGTTRYFITDDTVNESDEKIQELADIAQTLPFKLEWIGYLRLDLIGSRPHTIQTLKDSGLKGAFFGIESFHKSASKTVGKGWNGVHGKDFLLELKSKWGNDVLMQLGFIVGLPEESMTDLLDTHNWCIANEIGSWNFHPLHIERNSGRAWTSEFDRNHFEYGYSFPNPLDNEFWKNEHWDRAVAKKAAEHLNNDAFKYAKNGVWMVGELASLGHSIDSIMHLCKKDTDMRSFEQGASEFVSRYITKKTT